MNTETLRTGEERLMNRAEILDTAGVIKKKIEDVFPFRDESERDAFVTATEQVAFGTTEMRHAEFVRAVTNALDVLKNSHTHLRRALQGSMDDIEFERIKNVVHSRILDDSIGYVCVGQWLLNKKGENTGDEAWEAIQKLGDISSLIIDVRENGGGNSEAASNLAGHFLSADTKYTRVLRRHSPNTIEIDEDDAIVNARRPFSDTPIVILTGPRCLSSNEMFILMLKDTGRAITVGGKTGGGSGNADSVPLMLGNIPYELLVSSWRIRRLNGEELEGRGIAPDIEVQVSDTFDNERVLRRAVEHLKKCALSRRGTGSISQVPPARRFARLAAHRAHVKEQSPLLTR